MANISTASEFWFAVEEILACSYRMNDRARNRIYELFEFNTEDSVRAAVYEHADPECLEPFRSAMHAKGYTDY